ncbi:hypothetical protein D3C78_17700 [compost metagenome]
MEIKVANIFSIIFIISVVGYDKMSDGSFNYPTFIILGIILFWPIITSLIHALRYIEYILWLRQPRFDEIPYHLGSEIRAIKKDKTTSIIWHTSKGVRAITKDIVTDKVIETPPWVFYCYVVEGEWLLPSPDIITEESFSWRILYTGTYVCVLKHKTRGIRIWFKGPTDEFWSLYPDKGTNCKEVVEELDFVILNFHPKHSANY